MPALVLMVRYCSYDMSNLIFVSSFIWGEQFLCISVTHHITISLYNLL